MYAVLLLCFASSLTLTTSKRYDIELEAIKLFGEDLNSVLARFRRTPQYLDIITDRFNELKNEKSELGSYLIEIYRVKLIDKLNEMFGSNVTVTERVGLRSRNTRGRGLRHSSLVLNAFEAFLFEVGPWATAATYHREDECPTLSLYSKGHLRQQLNGVQNDSNYLAHAVEALDNHPTLHSVLTVQERNRFKSIGFEIAGQFIDNVIEGMKTGEEPIPSTQQPWGDDDAKNVTTTTEHKHEVTSETPVASDTPVTIYVNELNNTDTDGSTAAPKRHRLMKFFK